MRREDGRAVSRHRLCGPHVTARPRLRAGTPGWLRGHESAPGSLRTSLLGKWTERRCASPSVKEGGGGCGDGHPSPRCPQVPRVTRPGWAPSAASEVHPASQLQGEHPQGHGGQAAASTESTVTVLFVHFTPGLLAQDPLEAHGADAALVLVAGATVLAEQELVIADIGEAALSPVVVGQAVVALGPRGTFLALTVAGLVAAVVHGADLVAVTFYADILIVQLGGAVAVEAQAAVLAVLAPRVVLAAHTGHHVQEVDVAAAVGVAVALTVCGGEEERAGTLAWSTFPPLGGGEELLWRRVLPGGMLWECCGHCQHRAGMCWAGGVHTVLHHHGGIGLEVIAQRAEQGRGSL